MTILKIGIVLDVVAKQYSAVVRKQEKMTLERKIRAEMKRITILKIEIILVVVAKHYSAVVLKQEKMTL